MSCLDIVFARDPYVEVNMTAEDAYAEYQNGMSPFLVPYYLHYAAFRGYHPAMYELGNLYYEGGRGLPKDHPLCQYWMRRCKKLGVKESKFAEEFLMNHFGSYDAEKSAIMGNNYIFGNSSYEKNYGMAFPWCKQAAEGGIDYQMMNLGVFLWNGYPDDGIPRNREEGELWLLRAASTGYPDAIKNVKILLKRDVFPAYCELPQWLPDKSVNGRILFERGKAAFNRKDFERATYCLAAACQDGYENEVRLLFPASQETAKITEELNKVIADSNNDNLSYAKRINKLEWKVGVMGFVRGAAYLGDLYLESEGSEEPEFSEESDWEMDTFEAWGKAGYYYLYGAVHGYYYCQYMLGEMLYLGKILRDDRENDYKRAAYWFMKCCDNRGGYEACLYLGNMYQDGLYYKKDLEKAMSYYLKGAEYGDMLCMFMVGKKYYNGNGCVQNLPEAFRYFDLGRQKGDDYCTFFVAHMLYYGEGISQDKPKARNLMDEVPSYVEGADEFRELIKRERGSFWK